jgi:hypothetical protein
MSLSTSIKTVKVSISNSGGVLSYRVVKGYEDGDLNDNITKAALHLIKESGHLLPGDIIRVSALD